MKKNQNLRDLLVTKLQSLYDVEEQLVEALPDMADASTHPDLKEAFRNHLNETRVHVIRIEQAFGLLGEKPETLKVEAIRGLVDDAKWCIDHAKNAEALDANLAAAARYVEHYEMAGYMTAISWAQALEEAELATLLGLTLAEEENADETVTALAESVLDEMAKNAKTDE